ncbi:MAG: alpha-E domain-containing protein [Burkholderiaceae bacterium]
MLSRLADHLFWMSRYIERAENTARMLDVQLQAAMLPSEASSINAQWKTLLDLNELQEAYDKRYAKLSADKVLRFMLVDSSNPSSIFNCLERARENARAVRGVLTTDIWEVVNNIWLEARSMVKDGSFVKDPARVFEWVKLQSHLFRGVTIGTMLKDEAFYFVRTGTFLERADNTARILDVKYLMVQEDFEERADFYFWSSLLRSVSAYEIYRKVYRDSFTPVRIAELLIQRGDMPRSLIACLDELLVNLSHVSSPGRQKALKQAGRIRSNLEYLSIDESFQEQMHEFLKQFVTQVNELGITISHEFLVPLEASSGTTD